MLRLLLLRHAKSAYPAGVDDHDRPLAARGRAAAPVIGRYMADQGLVPDLAVVSTARRAQQTWALAAEALAHVSRKCPRFREKDMRKSRTYSMSRESFLTRHAVGKDVPRRDEGSIYEARPAAILDIVRQTPPDVGTLLLVGHNPGFQDLAVELVGGGDEDAVARLRAKFSTAGLAVIEFDVPRWSDVSAGSGRLQRFVTPKSIKADRD